MELLGGSGRESKGGCFLERAARRLGCEVLWMRRGSAGGSCNTLGTMLALRFVLGGSGVLQIYNKIILGRVRLTARLQELGC